jgi:hypothetical protein
MKFHIMNILTFNPHSNTGKSAYTNMWLSLTELSAVRKKKTLNHEVSNWAISWLRSQFVRQSLRYVASHSVN